MDPIPLRQNLNSLSLSLGHMSTASAPRGTTINAICGSSQLIPRQPHPTTSHRYQLEEILPRPAYLPGRKLLPNVRSLILQGPVLAVLWASIVKSLPALTSLEVNSSAGDESSISEVFVVAPSTLESLTFAEPFDDEESAVEECDFAIRQRLEGLRRLNLQTIRLGFKATAGTNLMEECEKRFTPLLSGYGYLYDVGSSTGRPSAPRRRSLTLSIAGRVKRWR